MGAGRCPATARYPHFPSFLTLLALAALVSLAVPARAQPREGEFWPTRYEVGGLRFSPVVRFDNFYNDNIFASDGDEVDDYYVSIVPSLEVESLWQRHHLSVGALGRINRYADVTTEDSEEYAVDVDGRFDLTDESALGAVFGQGRSTVGRADVENSGRKGPQQLDFYEGEVSYEHEFVRIGLDLRGFVGRLDFVESIDSDRDRILFGGAPRLSYRFSPAFSVFLEPEAEVRDYDQKFDNDGVERSSVTASGYLGSEFDITSVIQGEIAVGVVHADFDESSFDDVTTVGVRGEATWDVTTLTRLELEAERRLAPTTIDGASSKIQTLASIRARHELLRNLSLSADFTYLRTEFEELSRTDDNFRIRARAEYVINRFFSVGLGYRFRVRETDANDKDFQRNILMFNLELVL